MVSLQRRVSRSAADWKQRLLRRLLCTLALLNFAAAGAQPLQTAILYLELTSPAPPLLSNVIAEPADSGLQGARLGIADNNSTGRFLQQEYQLHTAISDHFEELLGRARQWIAGGNSLIVASLPAPQLLKLTEDSALRGRALIFNSASSADSLRAYDCRSGVLHTLPSRAMRADALAQFLIRKRWEDWLLISGEHPPDLAFAEAIQRSARRFGANIVGRKQWSFITDLRRTAQQEIPPFTRGRDHDVVLVSDETGDFGEFLPYNTWLPRPVAGTQGLVATAWHRVIEQWGAAQLQRRFEQQSGRWMNSEDYAAWLAVRAIGEAVTRTTSNHANDLYAFLLDEKFELAAFKGRKLTFRDWNGQLRQPIALVHPRAMISQSPQEGFLHPSTDLDTLGFDRSEVNCRFRTQLGEPS